MDIFQGYKDLWIYFRDIKIYERIYFRNIKIYERIYFRNIKIYGYISGL